MSEPVDAALIAKLFERHASVLELYAAQHASATALDCVQEAFIELARQPAAPQSPAAWLFRVVRNRALNAARAASRRAVHEEAAGRDRVGVGADPADTAAVDDLLQALAPLQREIVVLRVWGALSWEEIAEVTGASRSTAHRTYVQALTTLRTLWESSPCSTTRPASGHSTKKTCRQS